MSAPDPQPAPCVEIAVAVVEHEGNYLIGLRDAEPLAGYWEFPGGKVAAGETPEAAARRECLEETGLEVRITGSYPAVAHDYAHARIQLSFFACAPQDQKRPLPARFRWVPAAQLPAYKFPPANTSLLSALTATRAHY